MTKKRNSILNPIDLLILILCLFLAAFFLNLFWKDLNQMFTKNEEPVATITYKRNSVQRKFQEKMVWDRLEEDGPIYNGDTLRTSPDAQATIHFPDGKTLDVFESSMIRIIKDKDNGISVEIDGETSRVSADASKSSSDSSFSIVSANTGSKIQVQKGSSITAAAAPEEKELQVQVQKGEALITSDAGENLTATEGTVIKVNSEGKARKPDFSVLFPSSSITLLREQTENSGTINFKWNKNKNTKVLIETSKDKNFDSISGSYIFDEDESKSLLFDEGITYWRAKAAASSSDRDFEGTSDSVSGKINVLDAKTPVLALPEYGKEIEYRTNLPKIYFTWKGNEAADYYILDVSDSSDFKTKKISRKVQGNSSTVQELSEGIWFWKVTPFYLLNKKGEGIASETGTFSIKKGMELSTPVPLIPKNDEKLIFGKDMNFSWKSMETAGQYEIIVSKNPNISDKLPSAERLIDEKVLENYLVINSDLLGEGEFYWALCQIDGENLSSSFCEARKFTVEKTNDKIFAKLISPSDGYTCEKSLVSNLSFTWTEPEENGEFQISKTSDFEAPIFSRKAENLSISGLSLDEGKYFWRVGNSKIQSFTVSRELDSAVLVSPSENQEVLIDKDTQTTFTWQPVSDADYYSFTLSETDDSSDGNKINLSKIKGTFLQVSIPESSKKDSDGHSSFKWTIQAFKDESETSSRFSGKASSQTFNARMPEKLSLVSPSNNTVLSGLEALLSPVKFSWNSRDVFESQTFILEKETVLKNGSIQRQTIKNQNLSKNSIQINSLESGKYFWHIKALSKGGTDMSSEESSFTVSEVPLLSKPVLGSPSDKTVFGAAYLRTSRIINFDWQSVPFANEYRFTLRRKDSKVPLIEKSLIKLNYSVNVSDLDLTEFVWSIQAFRKKGDGTVIQKSEESVSSFKIEIPLPKEVQALDQGVQYGE